MKKLLDLAGIQKIWTYAPTLHSLMVATTFYCDLECPHCASSCGKDNEQKYVPVQDIFDVVELLQSVSGNVKYATQQAPGQIHEVSGGRPYKNFIGLTGGEFTTVYEKHPAYISQIFDYAKKNKLILNLKSNGNIVNKDYYDAYKNDLSKLVGQQDYEPVIEVSVVRTHPGCVENYSKLITDLQKIYKQPKIIYLVTGESHHDGYLTKMLKDIARNINQKVYNDNGHLKRPKHMGGNPILWQPFQRVGRMSNGARPIPDLGKNILEFRLNNDQTLNLHYCFASLVSAKYRDDSGKMRLWQDISAELEQKLLTYMNRNTNQKC